MVKNGEAGEAEESQRISSGAEENVTEVIVSAQKRDQRLQDVPIPVTSVNADALLNSNQLQLQDYYSRIPGLSVAVGGDAGAPLLTIRGITTGGFANPTVGIVVDDVSYGSSTSQGSGFTAPDIDPSDLERIEVLRGPQGTLYGASSIGGLVKYMTVDPSTAGFSGRMQAGINNVYNGDEVGYAVRGAVNIPLGENWAVRASGFARRDPGYIEDPVRGVDGVNWADAEGGRLSALWQASDTTSLKLSALYQESERHGAGEAYVQANLGDLQQTALRGTGGYRNQIEALSANLNAKLGSAALTSVTGYSNNSVSSNLDATPALSVLSDLVFGELGTTDPVKSETEKFTQELRLSVPLGTRLDWLFGAFYTHEDISQHQSLLAADVATGAIRGSGFEFDAPYTFEEYAAFADITIHVTDRFDVQVGGRESRNKQTYSSIASGSFVPYLYGAPSPVVVREVTSEENAFTYLLTPQLKISPDLMLYVRLASGYRPGGPTPNAALLGLPLEYRADKTQNYEIGVKGDVLDRRLSFDASVYYIDWKDIQIQLRDSASLTSYLANGSRAKSQGVEFSIESRPLTGMTISSWVSWNEAHLTEDFPVASTAVGLKDDRLPYSSRFSGSLSLDQELPLRNGLTGFFGGSVSYVGDRKGTFQPASLRRQEFPAYAKTDVRFGVRYNTLTFNAFVNNVTDRRGVLRGGVDNLMNPFAFNYIQPRTVGLSLTKQF